MDFGPWPPYFEHASCRAPDVDVNWFFPERGQPTDRAKKICAGCPVQLDCREWSMTAPALLQGVWGGLSQRERHAELRKRRILGAMEPAPVDLETPSTNGYHEPETPGPQCAVCSQPIPERRAQAAAKTCGDACAETHRKQRRAAAEARKRATGPVPAPIPSLPPPPITDTRNAPPPGLLEVLAGAGVTVMVGWAGRTWALTPQGPGG